MSQVPSVANNLIDTNIIGTTCTISLIFIGLARSILNRLLKSREQIGLIGQAGTH